MISLHIRSKVIMAFFLLGCISFLMMNIQAEMEHSSQQRTVKTSLIIPCYYGHAKFLHKLLEIYEQQTVLPDEVVIALSEINKIEPSLIESLQNKKWSFPVTVVASEKKMNPGENRNNACSHASGDIFICQDADDIPHPQRIEIIKYFFENFEIDHLLHQFIFEHDQLEFVMDKTLIGHIFPSHINEAWQVDKVGYITAGNPSMRRTVFQKIKWGNGRAGEDVLFNSDVYDHFDKRIVIKFPLYIYRYKLSSTLIN